MVGLIPQLKVIYITYVALGWLSELKCMPLLAKKLYNYPGSDLKASLVFCLDSMFSKNTMEVPEAWELLNTPL